MPAKSNPTELTDRDLLLAMLKRARLRGQLLDPLTCDRARVLFGSDDELYLREGGDPDDVLIYAGDEELFTRFTFNADGSLNDVSAWEEVGELDEESEEVAEDEIGAEGESEDGEDDEEIEVGEILVVTGTEFLDESDDNEQEHHEDENIESEAE